MISAGESHSAAVMKDGDLYMWGNGSFGRLGTGFLVDELKPALVQDFVGQAVETVSCGYTHTLVVLATGKLYSFGQQAYEKLGTGLTEGC